MPIGGPIIGPVGGPAPLTYPPKYNHAATWPNKLLFQLRSSPLLQNTLKGLLSGAQDATDCAYDILTKSLPDAATGAQVDVLGALRAVPREGRTDGSYLTAQHASVVARRSAGMIADIYETLEAILPGGDFRVLDLPLDLAAFVVQIRSPAQAVAPGSADTPSVPQLHLLLERARAAGVTLYFEWWPTDVNHVLTFAGAYGLTDHNRGFADQYPGHSPTMGGQFVGEEIA